MSGLCDEENACPGPIDCRLAVAHAIVLGHAAAQAGARPSSWLCLVQAVETAPEQRCTRLMSGAGTGQQR